MEKMLTRAQKVEKKKTLNLYIREYFKGLYTDTHWRQFFTQISKWHNPDTYSLFNTFNITFPVNVFYHLTLCPIRRLLYSTSLSVHVFYHLTLCPMQHLLHSTLFPVNVVYFSMFCPVRRLLPSFLCPFVIIYNLTFCPSDVFYYLTFFPLTFCPNWRFFCWCFLPSAFFTLTFCRWIIFG